MCTYNYTHMENFNYYKIKTLEEDLDVYRFYYNINYGETTNCLIIEVDANNPLFEKFLKFKFLKYYKIISEESAFHLQPDGEMVPMVKVLLDKSNQELWLRQENIKSN